MSYSEENVKYNTELVNNNQRLSVEVLQEPFQFQPIYNDDKLNELYEKYTNYTHNSDDYYSDYGNKVVLKHDRNKESLSKKYYVILEYTKVFTKTKYCHLKFQNSTRSMFENDADFNRYFSQNMKYDVDLESNNNDNDANAILKSFNTHYHFLDTCKYKNCFFTCDKNTFNKADALMFHESDFKHELNDKNLINNLIKSRNRDQIWFVYNDEPHVVDQLYDQLEFNWTMSYYGSADTSYCTYGCYKHKQQTIDYKTFKSEIFKEYKKRVTNAVWFNSNCDSKLRIMYGGKLANYFSMSIIGNCYKYIKKYITSKAFNVQHITNDNCKRFSQCEYNLLTNNKFYLAFESTNCSDYITEKFWRSLSMGLIPIVLQPAKRHYTQVAPPDSFIHLEDFNYNVERLAEYLNTVSNNFNLYLTYFKWKHKFDVLYLSHEVEGYRLCEVCAKLNSETSSIYYKSISNWYNKKCHRIKTSKIKGFFDAIFGFLH